MGIPRLTHDVQRIDLNCASLHTAWPACSRSISFHLLPSFTLTRRLHCRYVNLIQRGGLDAVPRVLKKTDSSQNRGTHQETEELRNS